MNIAEKLFSWIVKTLRFAAGALFFLGWLAVIVLELILGAITKLPATAVAVFAKAWTFLGWVAFLALSMVVIVLSLATFGVYHLFKSKPVGK